VLAIYIEDTQIPENYVDMYGSEEIVWAGEYRGIIT